MAYTRTTWVDNTAPYITAANLNNIETGIQSQGGAVFNVKDAAYGALGNGTGNDTAAVQAAIDAATALADAGDPYGGIVFFPPGHYVLGEITVKNRVQLIGAPMLGQGYRETPVRLVPHAAIPDDGFMFKQSGTVTNVVMAGLSSYGEGPTSKTGWINLPDAQSSSFYALHGDNWGIETFILGGGNNRVSYCLFEGLWNTTYIAAGATVRGAFTLSGADHQVSHNEFTGPITPGAAVSSAALECAAAVFTMSSSEVDTNVFQLGDVGLHLNGGVYNRFLGNRFDYNAAHGLLVNNGSIMSFTGDAFNHNSSATANTYDHINVPSGGGSPMQFFNPMFSNNGQNIRYWINDAKNHITFRNVYVGPHGEAAGTANTNITGNSVINYPSMTGSATYDPPSLANGAAANTTVTVNGAVVGDTVLATHSSVQTAATSWILTGYVSAADTVRIVLLNATGGTVDLGSGTLRVRVFRQ